MDSKEKELRYSNLVTKFKKYEFSDKGLLNPYQITPKDSTSWSKHNKINPWELWHGNLNAEIIFIGQDFSGHDYFVQNFDNNWTNEREKSPTNRSVAELFSILDYNIGMPGDQTETPLPLYFTNSVLGIKQKGMAGAIKSSWYAETAKIFTKEIIELINPKHIIVMGKHAYHMICKAYDKKPEKKFNEAIDNNGNNPKVHNAQLFVVAHCSGLGKVNRRPQEQKKDWERIKKCM